MRRRPTAEARTAFKVVLHYEKTKEDQTRCKKDQVRCWKEGGGFQENQIGGKRGACNRKEADPGCKEKRDGSKEGKGRFRSVETRKETEQYGRATAGG